MLEVATTLWSQPPRLSEVGALILITGREATNGAVTPAPKVAPLPALIFILFKTLAMACVNVRYHSGGSMKLIARILHLAYMVYL